MSWASVCVSDFESIVMTLRVLGGGFMGLGIGFAVASLRILGLRDVPREE